MALKATGFTKFLGIFLVVLAVIFGGRWAINNGWVPGMKTVASVAPEKRSLEGFASTNAGAMPGSGPAFELPGNEQANPIGKTQIRGKFWAWNTQAGIWYANGGPVTTRGSLMDKNGIFLTVERQDDTNILRDELLTCAKELSDGKPDCSKGIHFTAVMGDQLGAQLAAWNPIFRKLGDDLIIEAVGFGGRSFGEDAYLASPAVKANPQNARGTVVAAAPREGDQNIVIYWAAQNGLLVNPDFRTYDPDAVNFMAAESYTKAAEMYNAGTCESRPIVQNGKRTGEKKEVCVDSVTTWTPGDVTVTVGPNARGGLVRIWSTRENSSQMPNTILGIKRWNAQHRNTVVSFLRAVTDGGSQVKYHREALKHAMELSAQIYKENDGAYWYRYYLGVEELDAQGNKVQLGGSQVFDLADNLAFFGLQAGQANAFKASYETFGAWMHQYYPTEVPQLAPYAEIANTSYIEELQRVSPATTTAMMPQFVKGSRITEVGARRSWTIEFQTGSAQFTQNALRTVSELHDALVIGQEVLVEVHGHTDSTGTAEGNMSLSEERAFAVKNYLEQRSPGNFPEGRIRVVAHGQVQPLVPNSSPANMAKNRRVEVVIGR